MEAFDILYRKWQELYVDEALFTWCNILWNMCVIVQTDSWETSHII